MEESNDVALEVGQPTYGEAKLEAQTLDDATITVEDACIEAAAFNTLTPSLLIASRCTSLLPLDLEYHQTQNPGTIYGRL